MDSLLNRKASPLKDQETLPPVALSEEKKKKKRKQAKKAKVKKVATPEEIAEREAKKHQRLQKREEENKASVQWLCEKFPKCFNYEKPLPLKTGIVKDLRVILKDQDNSLRKKPINRAVAFYTASNQYQEALIKQTHRIDLEGNPVELILQTHKEHAKEILSKLSAEKQKDNAAADTL